MSEHFNLEKTLRRIEAKVSKIAISTHVEINKEEPKQTWVSVGVIKDITGWKREELRRARENKLVLVRKEGNSVRYLLESLHPKTFKKYRDKSSEQ